MPYPVIVDPVPGTVITAAWEIANALAAVRWLRQLMGNADPSSGSLALISSSPSAGSWAKIPPDALAPGAVVAHLTYTPANQAGDTFVGNVAAPNVSVSGSVTAGQYQGGSKLAGLPALLGLNVGGNGIASDGPITPSDYRGGSLLGGIPSVLGLNVGANGIASNGPITPSDYRGGSLGGGIPSMLGLNLGANGIATAGHIVSSLIAGAPYTAVSTSVCTGVNADMVDGANASATPGAGQIPIADGTGKLNAGWLPASGISGVPSGAIVAFDALASLTAAGAGWTRHTAADGRLLVGDGTTFGQGFAQGGSYGASWAHAHSTPAHAHSGSPMSVSGTTGAASGSGNQSNVATPNPANATQSHTHDLGTLGVAGNTANDGASNAGSTTWLPAMFGVVWGRKL